MKKIIVVSENVFKSSINIFLGYSFDELNDFLVKKGMSKLSDDNRGCSGLSFWELNKKTDENYCSIWFEKFDWSLSFQSLLVHELSHSITDILDIKGIKTAVKNDEVFAYLMEYYFYNTSKILVKLKKR